MYIKVNNKKNKEPAYMKEISIGRTFDFGHEYLVFLFMRFSQRE